MRLDRETYDRAWREFLAEDYESSLQTIRRGLDEAEGYSLEPLAIVPAPGTPTIHDGIVLCARNLFQLELYAEFEVLQASAGRWGLVPAGTPELDVIHLNFVCKRGDYLQVVREATAFIDQHRRDLPPVIADYLYLRGLAHSHMGDPERALQDAEAANSLFRVLGRDYDSARSANLMGILCFRSADYTGARRWFGRALAPHTRLGMHKNMGGNRLNLGIAAYKLGEFDLALDEFGAADGLFSEVDAQVSRCRAAIARGHTYRLRGDLETARRLLMGAYEDANRLLLAREEALALEFLGDVSRQEGRIDQARRFYSRALAIGRSIAPEGDVVMEVLRRQGQCLLMLGRPAEALSVLGRALGLARRQGDRLEEAVIRRVLAETLLETGDLDGAGQYCLRAVELLEEVGVRHELARVRLVAAEIDLARLDSGLSEDPGRLLEGAWQAAMSALDLLLKTDVDRWIRQARRLVTLVAGRRADQERLERQSAVLDPQEAGSRRGGQVAPPIIHVSSRMRDLIQLCDAFADSGEPVLVTGGTGTGKELFARRLHDKSARRRGELVCVNVTAIPDTIFAREFFGHVRGSFSGAESDGIGLAARADGGTLFLDEIGELPLELQPQLLRLLQDGTYQAIGDPKERRADIRLVAATNADLRQLVAEGRFRADLYYRLKILELKLPPISDRREDILPLLGHFLARAAGRPVELSEFFNRESLEAMRGYGWPGNVREIAMVARQARVQLASCGRVSVEVGEHAGEPLFLTGPGLDVQPSAVRQAAAPLDGRSRILLALAEADGNRAQAARRLGVSRSTLYRQMERMGIAAKATVG